MVEYLTLCRLYYGLGLSQGYGQIHSALYDHLNFQFSIHTFVIPHFLHFTTFVLLNSFGAMASEYKDPLGGHFSRRP